MAPVIVSLIHRDDCVDSLDGQLVISLLALHNLAKHTTSPSWSHSTEASNIIGRTTAEMFFPSSVASEEGRELAFAVTAQLVMD